MNLNYATVMKEDLDKLLVTRFIALVGEVTWLSPIVVVSTKNGKLQICEVFQKLNVAIKKDLYPLLFIEEIQDMVARHEVYSFLDGFLGYH
jgi:hypothetical protein